MPILIPQAVDACFGATTLGVDGENPSAPESDRADGLGLVAVVLAGGLLNVGSDIPTSGSVSARQKRLLPTVANCD